MKIHQNNVIEGQIFVPKIYENSIKTHIMDINDKFGTNIIINYDDYTKKRYKPPTFNKQNDFTSPF